MEIMLIEMPEDYRGFMVYIDPKFSQREKYADSFGLHEYDIEEIEKLSKHKDFLSGAKVIKAEDEIIEIIIKCYAE